MKFCQTWQQNPDQNHDCLCLLVFWPRERPIVKYPQKCYITQFTPLVTMETIQNGHPIFFFLKLITFYLWVIHWFCFSHVIVTQRICIFTLGMVYATLMLMIFFPNAGQIIKDAIIRTPITQSFTCISKSQRKIKINTQTRRLPNLKALPLLRESLRVLKLTKNEQNKLRKQARKKCDVTHNWAAPPIIDKLCTSSNVIDTKQSQNENNRCFWVKTCQHYKFWSMFHYRIWP